MVNLNIVLLKHTHLVCRSVLLNNTHGSTAYVCLRILGHLFIIQSFLISIIARHKPFQILVTLKENYIESNCMFTFYYGLMILDPNRDLRAIMKSRFRSTQDEDYLCWGNSRRNEDESAETKESTL